MSLPSAVVVHHFYKNVVLFMIVVVDYCLLFIYRRTCLADLQA